MVSAADHADHPLRSGRKCAANVITILLRVIGYAYFVAYSVGSAVGRISLYVEYLDGPEGL
jgi:hypothetical protein